MMKLFILALLFSLVLVGGSVQAQTLNTTGSVNVNGSASTGSNDTGISTDADASAEANVNANDSDSASANGSGDMNGGSGIGFNILRSKMDVSTDYAVTKADSVRTSASLESYAGAIVRADERLNSVEMNEGRMDMEYKKPAKFLWIFPASLKAHITVDQEGVVTARYPWYAFLMSTDESRTALEAEIRNEIELIDESMGITATAEAAGATSTGIQGNSEIRRWARIIEAVYIAVSGDARVDASAQAPS